MAKSWIQSSFILLTLSVVMMFQNCSPADFDFEPKNPVIVDPFGDDPQPLDPDDPSDPSDPLDPDDPTVQTQTFSLPLVNQRKLDVLFVIDNSDSMEERQANLASRIQGFMNHLRGIDYQIGFISTGKYDSILGGDGVLIDFKEGKGKILRPSSTTSNAEADRILGQSLQIGVAPSGSQASDERGINGTYRAIERRRTDAINNSLLRDGVPLAVIVLTDEDECSDALCLDPTHERYTRPGHGPMNSRPQGLLDLVKREFGTSKNFIFHAIAANQSRFAQPFTQYSLLTAATGGVYGDSLAADYTSQLQNIGESSIQLLNSFELACDPLNDVIQFYMNSSDMPINLPFTRQGRRVTFPNSVAGGNYSARYQCTVTE